MFTLSRLMRCGTVATLLVSAFLLSSQQTPGAAGGGGSGKRESAAPQIFASNCAACHGLDGSGTQRAPNIVTAPRVQELSSKEILRIVSDGIPQKGMPGFRSLGEAKLSAVVKYVTDLQGRDSARSVPGNQAQGKQIFSGSARCSSCHMIEGKGGFIAPDLTDYANTHSAKEIAAAITDSRSRDSAPRLVTVITSDGEYQGVLRNEDNFSVQLQSLDGTFHFFSKADVQRIDRSSQSIMPSDYGSRLTADQINDVVSYLIGASRSSKSASTKHRTEDED